MPRFGEYSPDTSIDGTELFLLRAEDGQTRYASVDTIAEYVEGSPGGGTPPVVVEIVTETASFSVSQATHAAKHVRCSHASGPIVITLPANATSAIDVGCVFTFVWSGVAAVSFAWNDPTVTVNGLGLDSADDAVGIVAQYGVVTAVKEATNTWLLVGNLDV